MRRTAPGDGVSVSEVRFGDRKGRSSGSVSWGKKEGKVGVDKDLEKDNEGCPVAK